MKMKKSDGGGGGANWMDTYGDMVTLLLCFFVLLYSMSTIDENKWKALVQSFNPNAVVDEIEPIGGQGGIDDPMPPDVETSSELISPEEQEMQAAQEEIDQALEMLYQQLRQYIVDSGKNIELTKGDGVVYVNFDDTVFFDGEEYTIKPEGEETLNVVCGVLDQAADYIDEVRVLGHTAQANLDRPNTVSVDRFLASNRATNTVIYIQEHCAVFQPDRLISESYGQWRPLAPNEDEAGRARNRRVEMVISGKDMFNKLGDSIQQYNDMINGVVHEPDSESSADSASSEAESSAPLSNAEGQEGS